MTTHLIVIPYGKLLIECHSYRVTDGMAVSTAVHSIMAKHAAHSDDNNCWPRGYHTQENPGVADYLGFCFQALKEVNARSVPI